MYYKDYPLLLQVLIEQNLMGEFQGRRENEELRARLALRGVLASSES